MMLKNKIKGIIRLLHKVEISYICELTNEPEKKVRKILDQLRKEKFIK